MQKVHLSLKKQLDRSYDIVIAEGILKKIPEDLKKENIGNQYLIITDSNIEPLFGKPLLNLMKAAGLTASLISFKAGEQSKNLETLKELLTKTQELSLDRKSAIIALGGGVVGDIAGLVAATYMRGINYIQIPTSLLAMVDSSIGGKVAVDLPTGKNIVGSFYQPKKVYIDVSLLKNLPKKELINGLAEVIKHIFIKDKSLFNEIKNNLNKILNKDESTLINLIKRNCEIKARIVEQDEHESGIRKLVNYGHTIGHAIETLTHYKKYTHGEAIGIGMAVGSLISNKIGMLSKQELAEHNKLIAETGLPTKIPDISSAALINELKKDKKVVGGSIEFVLLESIGKAKYGIKVPDKIIKEAIEESK